MATGNLDSADLKAVAYGGLIHEDVMNRIWDISRIPLAFTDRIGTGAARNSYREWTQDTLAQPDVNNAKVDGADTTGDNDTVTGARVGNHCQISTKTVQVSTRARESDTIGRSDELAYQVMRRQQDLRRDVNAIMLTEQASVADDGNTTAGQSGGLGAWLTTNASLGAGGSRPGFANGLVGAVTPGTVRPLTETLVRDISQSVYQQGGDPTVFITIPELCRKFSEYLFTSSARVATLYSDTGQSQGSVTAKGSVKVFESDFSTLELVDDRLMQAEAADRTNVYIIDPAYLSIDYLHGYRVEPLGKTGLADKRQMAVDWTLRVSTEKSHGIIADIDFTQDVTA